MSFYLFMCLWTAGSLGLVTVLAICADRKAQNAYDRNFARTEGRS